MHWFSKKPIFAFFQTITAESLTIENAGSSDRPGAVPLVLAKALPMRTQQILDLSGMPLQ
jgi:hypothetical protein